jgi:hypothetical protein
MAAAQASTTPPSAPPARAHHAIFYDEARHRILLTGGTAVDNRRNYTLFNDLWSFDGTRWTALASSGDPMSDMRIAVDAQHRIYSLGGFTGAPVGDVRVLDNDRWRRIGSHPSHAVAGPGFVFDAARNRLVEFGGGINAGQAMSDVWEYDGTRWSKSAATAPPSRSAHAMAYDARRTRTVVFGGMGVRRGEAAAPMFDDTWEFDGTTWTQLSVAGPAARLGAGVTYDSKRGLTLVFGGANHDRVFNDLWSWDGTAWRKLAENGPEPRVMGYIAYDQKRDRVVLFGGRRGSPENTDLGDTWEWDGATWRRVA